MKKIIAFMLCIAITQASICQTETFDIAAYTPPKDWQKDVNTGVIAYTDINSTKGGFCILSMYASSVGLGNAQKDFNSEWKARVVTSYNADANPKTETQATADGWKAVSAAAPITLKGLDAYAILTVFSGFGKKFSVMVLLNDQSYTNRIDSFLKDIKLDKNANVVVFI